MMKAKLSRGRKKGGVCFVTVTLKELNSIFKAGASIPVSRVWVEELGLSGKPIASTAKNMSALIPIVATQEENQPINVLKNQW